MLENIPVFDGVTLTDVTTALTTFSSRCRGVHEARVIGKNPREDNFRRYWSDTLGGVTELLPPMIVFRIAEIFVYVEGSQIDELITLKEPADDSVDISYSWILAPDASVY